MSPTRVAVVVFVVVVLAVVVACYTSRGRVVVFVVVVVVVAVVVACCTGKGVVVSVAVANLQNTRDWPTAQRTTALATTNDFERNANGHG